MEQSSDAEIDLKNQKCKKALFLKNSLRSSRQKSMQSYQLHTQKKRGSVSILKIIRLVRTKNSLVQECADHLHLPFTIKEVILAWIPGHKRVLRTQILSGNFEASDLVGPERMDT